MSINVQEIHSPKGVKAFIDYPHHLHKNDPCYVPELYIGMKELFDPNKNPFFEHSKVQLFLAYQDQEIVGRIAAIRNNNYNTHHQSNVGFIGFLDFENDFAISKALFKSAKKWLKDENLNAMIGPTNFSTNDTAGLLIEGFETPPIVMMTYNPPYYQKHFEHYGFKKDMDLLAYMIETEKASPRTLELSEQLEKRLNQRGIKVRSLNLKNWNSEIKAIKKVYNAAWEKNWGFVPFTDKEFDHLAEGLKFLADPDFCFVAEAKGEIIGFSITLPNINEILIDSYKGRLLPWTIFKLLWNKKKTEYVRILALGILEEYRNKGIEGIFYAKNIAEAKRRKIKGGEASWILENNLMMNKGAENLNGYPYKRYRLYRHNF